MRIDGALPDEAAWTAMVETTNGFMQEFRKGGRSHFMQPLAVALVVAVFALLFFSMAMMDLGRLENLLMDALKGKALYVVEVMEKSSEENYRVLMRDGEEYQDLGTGTGIDDRSFSLQELLARALIDVARRIDTDEEPSDAFRSKVRELASSEDLRAVGLFDGQGAPTFETAPLPPDIVNQVRDMVRSREDITVHLFHETRTQDLPSFVAIRRQGGKGAIVLVLDRGGMEHWGSKIAAQAALDELQWGTGVAYMSLKDNAGRSLAQFGDIPSEKAEECLRVAGTAGPGEIIDVQCLKSGDKRFLELTLPFAREGKTVGTARVGLESQEANRLLTENRRRIFLWTGLMVLIGLLAMWVLYRTQNRHLARIHEMRERLYQAERLSCLGKLGAGVAHEIRNPLNAISMAAQRLQSGVSKEKLERISHIIQDETSRLNNIVEDFLSLSRSNRMEFRPQPLTDLLDRVFFLLREEAGPRGIQVEKQWKDSSLQILMDTGRMEQALLNVVRNAMESISGEGRITMSCESRGERLAGITIKDTGKGIPEGEEKRIFDPFYTSKTNGVGLGLAIAHEIVVAHGGEIRVKSRVGKGSTFEILLPVQS